MKRGETTEAPPTASPPRKTEQQQRPPTPSEGASECGDEVQDAQQCERASAADGVSGAAGADRAEDSADEGAGHREAEEVVAEGELSAEGVGGAGDNGGVEAEQQAAQRGNKGATEQIEVEPGLFAIGFKNGWMLVGSRHD